MRYEILKEDWYFCKICNKKINELAKIYGGGGIYYTQVFRKHLLIEHNLEPEKYFIEYCDITNPICPCQVCEQKLLLKKGNKSSNFQWEPRRCGRNEGQKKWSEEAKKTRLGKNNPAFGKIPWNKGLDKSHPSIKKVSEKNTGKKASLETREKKQSESAKKRLIHGHSGHKHSEENKQKARIRTLKMIQDGVFTQLKSNPHILMSKILDELKIKYNEECTLERWSVDFHLYEYNLYIEVDGDYFHSNPKIYPEGPKTKTQKINWYRDIKKNEFYKNNNINVLRFWECDIINQSEEIKKIILCKLKELHR